MNARTRQSIGGGMSIVPIPMTRRDVERPSEEQQQGERAGAAGGPEQQSLGDVLPEQASASRAERLAHRGLVTAAESLDCQQTGDVGAGDQHHQRARAEGRRPDDPLHHRAAERMRADRSHDVEAGGAELVVVLRVLLAQPRAQRVHLCLRRGPTSAGLETRDQLVEPGAVASVEAQRRHVADDRLARSGHPDVGRRQPLGAMEARAARRRESRTRTPAMSSVWSRTSGRRWNIDCHRRSLITAPRNGDGGVSSAAVNGRPSCMRTPSTSKYDAVTHCIARLRAAWPPPATGPPQPP